MSTVEITSPHSLPRLTTARAYRSAVESVLTRMRESSDAPLCLADMAEVAGVSRCHFDRLFRTVTGLTPRQFQTALRLHTATRLLLTTSRNVTEICFDAGYESLGSFVTKFTSTFGLPPQRLRQIAARFDEPLMQWLARVPAAEGDGVRGDVASSVEFGGAVFVGLFRERLPQESPAACAILLRPGAFAMAAPADGRYHAMAIGMRPEQRAIDILLDDAIPRAASAQPLLVHHGVAAEPVRLVLREPELIDPPVNLTLPLLLQLAGARP